MEIYSVSFFRRLRETIGIDMKAKTDSDAVSSLSSAYIALKTKLNLRSSGRSAICIKKVDHERFNEMKEEIERFLDASQIAFELTYRTIVDPYNYLWIILVGKTLEDIVAAIMSISDMVEQKGFSDRLLASVFNFDDGGFTHYLIYSYRLDKFYPFVPISEQKKTRNHSEELKIMSAMGNEVPFEKEMSKWYPIWNIPI
jgi:hypothetical protein